MQKNMLKVEKKEQEGGEWRVELCCRYRSYDDVHPAAATLHTTSTKRRNEQ